MKISIGPYRDWWGPFQLADLLQKVGVSENTCHKLGERLSHTWVNTLCEWIHSKKKRKVKIHIDRWDTWSMDSTLAMIILPMLKQLKATKHGTPLVDDDDVPEGLNLRSTEAPPKENEWDVDENLERRWNWVLDEMIWAFEQLQPDCDWEKWYHSGVHDLQFEDCVEYKDCKRMVHGPNHTATFDLEGYTRHSEQIDNGLRLFGKHFRSLWD